MNKLAKRALWTAALTGGLWAAGAGVASAAGTDGSEGLGSGNDAVVSLSAPITLGGNALGILGDAESTGSSATTAPAVPSLDVSTSGVGGVLSGNAALVALDLPVTVAGNAIGILGDASSESSTATTTTGGSSGAGATTSGDDGLLSGALGVVDVAVPVTVGGNAVAVLGDATSEDSTVESSATTDGSGDAATSGDDGLVSGNQLIADVLAPVTVGGNAVGVLGDASSTGSTVESSATTGGSGDAATTGDEGALSGNQLIADVLAPVTVGGNAVGVLGDATSTGSTVESVTTSGSDGAATSGDDGLLSGNQLIADVLAPVAVGGNAVAILGDATSTASTVTSETGGSTDAPSTSGDDGLLSGSILDLDVLAPITIGGNAIGVIGDATSEGSTVTVPTIPMVPTNPTDPTDPTVPVDPTDPTVPGEPTDPTVPVDPTVPTDPTVPGDSTQPVVPGDDSKDPVLPGDDVTVDGGDSRADLPRSAAEADTAAATAGQLPRTGLEQPGILPIGLLMLALGMLLLVGARRVRSMR